MNLRITRSLAAASLVLGFATFVGSSAFAQTPAPTGGATRAQVKMDRDTFLSMARWDEVSGNYVLRDDMAMPAGVPGRAEVKAMRDKFLSMNKWNESTSQFVPVTGAPRDMSKLSRDAVKMETARFLKMYRYDEAKSDYVPKGS